MYINKNTVTGRSSCDEGHGCSTPSDVVVSYEHVSVCDTQRKLVNCFCHCARIMDYETSPQFYLMRCVEKNGPPDLPAFHPTFPVLSFTSDFFFFHPNVWNALFPTLRVTTLDR